MLPPQPVPVVERLSQFVEGWAHITDDPVLSNHSQGVQTSFYESTPSIQGSMGNIIFASAPGSTGNGRAPQVFTWPGYTVAAYLHRQGTTKISSRSSDLAKLNPKCHMNYSVIFTKISFYPENSFHIKKFKNATQ